MNHQVEGDAGTNSDYGIRRFRTDDADAFLELHGEIFDRGRGREWFAWKYEDNPYVYHVPIFVAEQDGELVGARPFFALELSVNGQRHLALQPGDAMVHPDHRQQGLFSRMNEAAIEEYRDGDSSFFFDFPSVSSGGSHPKLGWKRVAERPTYYRVQDPNALKSASSPAWASLAARSLKPLFERYNRIANRRLNGADGLTVERYDSIPSTTLAAIEDRRRDGIHVFRDGRFYSWRFDNPARNYTAYVAKRAGEPIAGLVVGTSADDGATVAVTDVTPLPSGTAVDGLETLLRRVVREYADSELLVAPPVLPDGLARRAGFRRDDRLPLSHVGTRTTHVVRELADGCEIDGLDLTDADNWRLTFSEQETN